MNKEFSDTVDKNEIICMIKKVRQGDQDCFSELVKIYDPLIESQVSKFYDAYDGGASREDLRQEAILKFYNAIHTYDIEQSEVEFGLYSKICISNALVSQLRLHKKHTAEQLTDSTASMFLVHDSEDPSDRVLEEERVKALYSVIRKNLSSFEYNIWCLYMSGRTAKEIGDAVNKDEKSVWNAVYRIRRKLRAFLK